MADLQEHGGGLVWECDPLGRFPAQPRPAMGTRAYNSISGASAGAIYEITGPFRAARPGWAGGAPPVTTTGPLINPPTEQPADPFPPAAPVPQTPPAEDVDAPTLRLAVLQRISLARLRANGLSVKVSTDEAVAIVVALRTSGLSSVPGKRGSVAKPKLVTLAKKGKGSAAGAGTVQVRVRIGPAQARRVEKAIHEAKRKGHAPQLAVRLTVQGRDARGNVAIANRAIAVVAPVGPARPKSRQTALLP